MTCIHRVGVVALAIVIACGWAAGVCAQDEYDGARGGEGARMRIDYPVPRRVMDMSGAVVEREPRILSFMDAQAIFGEITSIIVRSAGRNIILDGTVGTPLAQSRVQTVTQAFDNVIDLTIQKDNVEINAIIAQEIQERIGSEGVQVAILRGNVILSGRSASEEDLARAINIANAYSEKVVNNVEIEEKMVEIDLAFVSYSHSKDRTIGGTPLTSIGGSMNFSGNLRDAFHMNSRSVPVTLDTNLVWSFLAENSEHKVLNRPHLTTVTRKTATFHQGGERGYEVINQTSANTDFKEYGVMVSIMPELTSDGKIRCEVSFEVTLPEDNATRLDYTTYKTTATALLSPGQSLILSGLLRDIRERVRSGLPIIRNIPILNAFASQSRKTKSQEDLLLIVTPATPSCTTAPAESYSTEQMRDLPAGMTNLRKQDKFNRSNYKKDLITVY